MQRTPTTREHRGVAMLMVLISLLLATILTAGYLASRDNSAAIGANVVRAAEARWTAAAGLQFGIAIMQTESAWRTDHSSGKLLDDYPLATGTFDLDLIDAETGDVPDEFTDAVYLTATGTVDGVSQVATARVIVTGGGSMESIDVDLSEFVIFAGDIDIRDLATVARWLSAPAADIGEQLALGTQSTSMGAISIEAGAAPIDFLIYHGPGASPSLVLNNSGQPVDTVALLDQIPAPSPPATPGMPSTFLSGFNAINTDLIVPQSLTLNDLRASNGQITVQDGQVVYVRQQSVLMNGGLTVDGDATLVFTTPLIVSNGYIELTPGSTVTIFANGGIDMSSGYIGPQRADQSARDNSGEAPYVDPDSVTIHGGGNWRLQNNSVVQGAMYAPGAALRIDGDSAVYGSVMTQSLEMTQNAAIFYDGALNDRIGYTNLQSAVYLGNGHVKPELIALASLDPSTLTTLASDTGTIVKRIDATYKGTPPIDPVVPPSEPSPRPVHVQVDLLSFGDPTSTWETTYDDSYTAATPKVTNPKVVDLVTK